MRWGLLQDGESPSDDGSQNNETVTVGDELVPERVEEMIPGMVPDELGELLLVLVILAIGWYLSKVIVRVVGRTVAQRIERPSVTRTVLRAVRAAVLFFTLLIVASIIFDGFELLLSVTVISAIVGVILAPLVGSFVNGLFVLADRPYEIGDMIEIVDADQRGFVEDITIRYTKIFTLDNTFIVIPNSSIRERDVVNFSAEDERTRETVQFEVTYESDVSRARQLAERAARNVDDVISGGPDIRIGSARYPAAPKCYVDEYADSGVLLTLRVWVKHPYKLLAARSAIQERIRTRYADEGIEIAYPHTHHVFDETSGAAQVTVASGSSPDSRSANSDDEN
ncbi:mechanosensitive ion channel family protein [Halobacteria archaeon AArc-m2/3/4]|uniref:Mechanosensitive ion channel family protein n=1 Tax=Natronoglomus mannanivorans TaxID=2979990 RepID=A0AAP2YZU0_9EURY|nr:mechanosensitive ion channel family protein [Halobacteria archaeon AArc-xg1-1]MCU4973233.1 mechanosensitive ion channel family protein [Halobacteria archaeon AArc-m2/3/4]